MVRPACRGPTFLAPRAIPAVQVATYYHDIKRMDDAKVAEEGDEVRALHCFGMTGRETVGCCTASAVPCSCVQGTGVSGDAVLDIQPAAASDGSPAIHTFKVFLVQVRASLRTLSLSQVTSSPETCGLPL